MEVLTNPSVVLISCYIGLSNYRTLYFKIMQCFMSMYTNKAIVYSFIIYYKGGGEVTNQKIKSGDVLMVMDGTYYISLMIHSRKSK